MLYDSYARGGALNEAQAMTLLSVRETEQARAELMELYLRATGPAKKELWARLAAPAYANRISRLQALRDRLYAQVRLIGLEEVGYVRDRLADTLEQSYYRTTFDIQQGTGYAYDFRRLDDLQIQAALASDWSEKNWSDRIWDNNRLFADAVQDVVTVGIMAGLRYDELRDNLLHVTGMDDDEGARYRSARLIRTECSNIANQGHLMGYQAAEIEEYIFLATLDLVTSEVCRELDMQTFPVAEAQTGENLPPMHPNCRSTTMPSMSVDTLARIKRAARDPVTGKYMTVPGDMSYREWYAKYVETRKGVANGGQSDIIQSGDDRMGISMIDNIEQRNTGKGNPNAVLHFDVSLNNRQRRLLDALPSFDSRITVKKSDVSMTDLAALTAKTGDEFAMFTRRGERLIVRGNHMLVNVTPEEARELCLDGYVWSGHTHPGTGMNVLQPSTGDYATLNQFDQQNSSIYNSAGNFIFFERTEPYV